MRLAGISSLEQAKTFLREHHIAEFNRKFAQPAAEKGTAFRKCGRKDLDGVFSMQTEPTVALDNTVVLQNRYLQFDKTRLRNTPAGCTVTICEHLNGSVSVRWGPHLLTKVKTERAGDWSLLDRLAHHVHILEMNGESYRLKESKQAKIAKARS